MRNWLKKHFPAASDVFAVYSVIVFIWYSWAMIAFFHNFPSLILSASLGDILVYFCYGMTFEFLETVLVLAIILGLTDMVPTSWLKDDFVIGGSVLAGLSFFWISALNFSFGTLLGWALPMLFFLGITILVSVVLFEYIFRRISFLRRAVLRFSSSAGIFVYLYGFLSVIGIIVVIIRNVF